METNSNMFDDFPAQHAEFEINFNLRGIKDNDNMDKVRSVSYSENEQIDFKMLQKAIDNPKNVNGQQERQHDLMNPNQRHIGYGRSAFNVHPDATNLTQRHSEMSLKEWDKLIFSEVNNSKEPKCGFYSDRVAYNHKLNDKSFTQHDIETMPLTARSCDTSTGNPRIVPTIEIDQATFVSSPASSIESTARSSSVYPKSRRVNLLCASLHFIQELDLLGLVDILDAVRNQISQKYRKERENKL